MESHRKCQARQVLLPDRTRSKTPQQRNSRMGKASGGHRQNPGGLLIMSMLRNITSGLLSLFRKKQADRELNEELSGDRKSTRLNSSHMSISYAVFCLKKKNK